MTAVAPPVQLQSPSRTGWTNSETQNGFPNMSQEEVGKLFIPGPRKSAQRSNSSSSLHSNSSTSSASSNASTLVNGTGGQANDNWPARKKNSRGLWPPGKSEPTSGLSAARPQAVSTSSTGPSAASAISALHGPPMQSQQMTAGQQVQQNGVPRSPAPAEGSAFLYLLPINGTFERKTIHVPYYPDVLRIGRQTNAKTAPTATNGFFDSKVLSRQHAEVYAERSGKVLIRDVKSSNGTFVNGKRLSPENKESEPHELHEQDVLELGIDIVSEDQKTVVHHKVAARVEHAGISLAERPVAPGYNGAHPGVRASGPANGPPSAIRDQNGFQQQQWPRMWLQPISTEQIVKRLNRELNLAKQQQEDIARAKRSLDQLLKGEPNPSLDEKKGPKQKSMPSPNKNRHDVDHFSDPPLPPPSQPLPEKPDISKALNDPVIQPLLQRSETAKPSTFDVSNDHSNALFILTHELKAAKDQIPSLQDRVRALETQLEKERLARVTAEERAYELEHGPRKDSAEPAGGAQGASKPSDSSPPSPPPESYDVDTVQSQLNQLRSTMSDMKQTMESYRRRAEVAESQRDAARLSLQEMIDEKRAAMQENEPYGLKLARTRSRDVDNNMNGGEGANGHTIRPPNKQHIAVAALLAQAGVESVKEGNESRVITRQQAVSLQRALKREIGSQEGEGGMVEWQVVRYHGLPGAAALGTVIMGLVVMRWLNGWEGKRHELPKAPDIPGIFEFFYQPAWLHSKGAVGIGFTVGLLWHLPWHIFSVFAEAISFVAVTFWHDHRQLMDLALDTA